MFLTTQFRPEASALQSSIGLRASSLPDCTAVDAPSALDADVIERTLRPAGPLVMGRDRPIGGLAKRAMDIVIALLSLLLLAPFMLFIAVLIRVIMGGPAVFAQQRVGFDGSIFTCYKFRTMVVDAEEVLRRHLAANPGAAREWRETRKLRNDPRVGCIGNVLRKSSLDELPQLLNVLRGEMSIVGPRPVVPGELGQYGRHARKCFKARPGLTGIWQVSGRNGLAYSTRVGLDRFYVRNWSIWLDLIILIKTIPAVLSFHETA